MSRLGGARSASKSTCRSALADRFRREERAERRATCRRSAERLRRVTVTLICPRCGQEFEANHAVDVADAVVAHALDAHHHHLDRRVVLAHLDGAHPDDYER